MWKSAYHNIIQLASLENEVVGELLVCLWLVNAIYLENHLKLSAPSSQDQQYICIKSNKNPYYKAQDISLKA